MHNMRWFLRPTFDGSTIPIFQVLEYHHTLTRCILFSFKHSFSNVVHFFSIKKYSPIVLKIKETIYIYCVASVQN